MKLDIKKYYGIASQDPEFCREIRYFDGTVKMLMGDEVYCLIIKDGKLVAAVNDLPADVTADVVFDGNDDQWGHLLAKVPVPFYQCLQTTCVKHGMKMTNDPKTLAYLPAWNRMTKLMREMLNA